MIGASCTNYHEEDAPDGISINASELSFPTDGGNRSLTVRSGSKWSVVSSPEWTSVLSINPSVNAFEWVVDFSATSNNEYNREGVIVLTTRSETVKIQAIQEGKKGQYFAVESVSLSEKELTLTVGDSFPMSYEINPSNASIKDVTWESSVSSVATVSNTGQINAIAEGTTLITVTTNDGSKKATCTVTVKPVSVSSVSLDKESLTLTIGETSSLNATILPENAANKNVSWSSSETDVATVDSNGKVTALGVGKAMVTVTTEDGGKTATCIVTVNPISVTSVSLDQTSLTMTVGDSQSLTATVSPSNATDKSVSWSSNKTTVATVSSTGEVTAKTAGSAIITVTTTDGGKKATCSITVNEKTVSVTGVSLDKTSLSMIEGDSFALTATVLPSNATNKSVAWSSSNTSIATVSSSGLVTAKSVGTATITVKTEDGEKTATCSVTVKAKTISVTGVILNKSTLTLTEGESQSLIATVTPSNASNKEVSWSTSNPFVATVSSSGIVTAKATGTTTITVKTSDGAKTATCKVTVTAATVAVTGVSLSVSSYTIKVNSSLQLHATITPSNATDQSVTWSSSNTSVATVSCDGLVSPKGVGTTTITVKTNDGGKTATCVITVEEVTVSVTSVSLNQSSLSMLVGDSQVLTATVLPSNASNKNVAWSSSNTSIATVSSTGRVTAISPGSATIIVTTENGGKTASCRVTVTQPVTSVSLNKSNLSMTVGDSETLIATVLPSNATDKSITWSSSNTAVATVSSSGLVTAKSTGTAMITVTTKDGNMVASCSVSIIDSCGKYDYVDLGLPSGNRWAKCNLGANGPTGSGDYYAFGEISTKNNYNWENYTWCKGNKESLTKYCDYPGFGDNAFIDNKKVLDLEDDAAYVILGDNWRTPTFEDYKELTSTDNTSSQYVSFNNVYGLMITSKRNGASIFFPVVDSKRHYWTSSVESGESCIYGQTFVVESSPNWGSASRCAGLPIRPILIVPIPITGVNLNRSSISMRVGEAQMLIATILPSNTNTRNKSVTWSSNNTAVATVSSSGIVTAQKTGTAIITVMTNEGGKTATCSITVQANQQTIDGHPYVEMGDGLKWATCNVGASSPGEYGDYFSWGETFAKDNYDWSTYKYGSSSTTLTKYVISSYYGTVDNKTTIEADDDAATSSWSRSWRMPTDEEWDWLRINCSWRWTYDYNGTGVGGYIVISNVLRYEGHFIFLPAAGTIIGTTHHHADTDGFYWSSSLGTGRSDYSRRISFGSYFVYGDYGSRDAGYTVRPVSE